MQDVILSIGILLLFTKCVTVLKFEITFHVV